MSPYVRTRDRVRRSAGRVESVVNLTGAYELFTCSCCGKEFWATRATLHQVLCDSMTLMPCNMGTPAAILRAVGPCCTEAVLDMINSLPPPSTDDEMRWAM